MIGYLSKELRLGVKGMQHARDKAQSTEFCPVGFVSWKLGEIKRKGHTSSIRNGDAANEYLVSVGQARAWRMDEEHRQGVCWSENLLAEAGLGTWDIVEIT